MFLFARCLRLFVKILQKDCFSLSNMQICDVLASVVVVVAQALYFLHTLPIKVRYIFSTVTAGYWCSIDLTVHCILKSERIIAKQNDISLGYKRLKQFR